MGCADSVAPHILSMRIWRRMAASLTVAPKAEIMVIAHTLNTSLLAAEEGSHIGAYLDRAYAEL